MKLTSPLTKPLAAGLVFSTGFTPASIPGLLRWLDPSDESTVTTDGSFVTQLDDKSGNDYHVTQGVASSRGRTNTLNGLGAIDFAFADGLTAGDDLGGFDFYYFFSVFEANNTGFQVIQNIGDIATSFVACGIAYRNTGQGRQTVWDGGNSRFISPTYSTGVTYIDSVSTDLAPDTVEWRTNGADLTLSSFTTGASSISAGHSYGCSYNSANASIGFTANSVLSNGKMGESVIVGRMSGNEMTAAEIQQVEQYLAAKWGVTLA